MSRLPLVRRCRATLAAVFVAGAYCTAPLAHAAWESHSLDLGFDVSTVRADAARNLLYVSAPMSNRVFVIDPLTVTVLREIYVGFHPDGIEFGSDGHTLYAALSGAGAVGVYDMNTDQQSEIDVSLLLGSAWTMSVVEARPGILFVSAENLVRIDLATLNASQVPAPPILLPPFGKDPGGNVLYIADNSGELDTLDITQVSAPIIYRAPQYLYGTDRSIDVSPDGTRLVLGSGEVIRANELTENGTVGPGVALFTAGGTQIVSARGGYPITLDFFDGTTLDRIDSVPTQCSFSTPDQGFPGSVIPTMIRPLPFNQGWVILGDTTVCVVRLPDDVFANGFE